MSNVYSSFNACKLNLQECHLKQDKNNIVFRQWECVIMVKTLNSGFDQVLYPKVFQRVEIGLSEDPSIFLGYLWWVFFQDISEKNGYDFFNHYHLQNSSPWILEFQGG